MDSAHQGQLEAILNGAVDAIITIDNRGIIQSANPATERLFGYAPAELTGQNISLLMPAPYRDEHDGYLESYLQSGDRKIIGIGREVIGRRRDGTTFPMHLAVSEIRIGDRVIFTGIVRDISDLKAVEKRLAEMNDELEQRVRQRTAELRAAQDELVRKEKLAMLGQVSGGIAHEIRNPLNAVKTSTFYLLNARQLAPEKMKEHLERIDRQVTLIDNVITALSDVAKLPEPKVAACDLLALLQEVRASVSLPPGIEVVLVEPDQPAMVLIDDRQIPIVFRNLLRNARDAMPEGGTITMTVKGDASIVEVEVRDTGVGISPEDMDRVLEPLYSTKARGMGLGLAISSTILEKNGGSLSVESQLGEGSTFTARLVRAPEEPPSQPK